MPSDTRMAIDLHEALNSTLLFTTKTVGKGTGLGLSVARQIVTDKHGGALFGKSIPGE